MSKKILVVDDDDGITETMKDILQEYDCIVDTVNNGTSAIDRVNKKPYDLVLMDVKMPGINGIEAFKKMKVSHPKLNVMFTTAYVNDEMRAEIVKEDRPVMCKPLDMNALACMIKCMP